MGLADFFMTVIGLLLMMAGLATTGYLNSSSTTLVTVISIIAGAVLITLGETRRS